MPADDPRSIDSVFERLGAATESMHVSRAFGAPYEVDGVTLVPVASVRGGGGGGSGEGVAEQEARTGAGAGGGFGIQVRPVGVYEIRDGAVVWHPAIDTMRIVVGGQLLALAALFLLLRRRRR
jgi:uncharacterized spore protein YtfJ